MALKDTFVKQVKHTGKTAGDKHSDGNGMDPLVREAAGKYWRMDYAHAGKRKTLALGVYPAVSLAEAREGARRPASCWPRGLTPAPPNKKTGRPRQRQRPTPSSWWRESGWPRQNQSGPRLPI